MSHPADSRDQARLDGLRRLFRHTGPETADESDRALETWMVRTSAGEDQLLAHRLRREIAGLDEEARGTRRAAE